MKLQQAALLQLTRSLAAPGLRSWYDTNGDASIILTKLDHVSPLLRYGVILHESARFWQINCYLPKSGRIMMIILQYPARKRFILQSRLEKKIIWQSLSEEWLSLPEGSWKILIEKWLSFSVLIKLIEFVPAELQFDMLTASNLLILVSQKDISITVALLIKKILIKF